MAGEGAVAKNSNLHNSRNAKNDEFYTRIEDIEAELKHYKKHFEGKVVLCNCDDPYESNFFKYFVLNFNRLKLKKLIATCYATSPIAGGQLDLQDYIPQVEAKKPYKAVITTVRDATGDGAITMEDITELFRLGENTLEVLEGDGDFRSAECLALLDEADIVCTNPPFSLFHEFVGALVSHKKQFLIIGNKNALTYKDIFPFIKENEIWLGVCSPAVFNTPNGMTKKLRGLTRWFTNLDIKKRHEEYICVKRYAENETSYPRYENYDAINVGEAKNIPLDYKGVMGVPISFMDKCCPEQFEIIGTSDNGLVPDEYKITRGLTQQFVDDYYRAGGTGSYSAGNPTAGIYSDGVAKTIYKRLFIRYTQSWIDSHPEDFR